MAAGGGGSWKVAYADFITALMAFFLVMWIVNQNQQVTGAVDEFFKNPWKAALSDSTGIIPVKDASVVTSKQANFENAAVIELNTVKRPNEDLIKTFIQNKEYREHRSLHVELTPDGLLISFLDDPSKPIFETDRSNPDLIEEKFTEYGAWVFGSVAWEIARYPDTAVELEGHTESGFQAVKQNYTSWEVSTARANLARRKLLDNGVRETQIKKVAGFGGTKPLKGKDATDALNRRVTIMLRAKI